MQQQQRTTMSQIETKSSLLSNMILLLVSLFDYSACFFLEMLLTIIHVNNNGLLVFRSISLNLVKIDKK